MREHLHFIMGRYDHYFDSVNNKGQFYLGLCTFLLGGYGICFTTMQQQQNACSAWLYLFISLLSLFNFIAIFFTLRAILPYLKSGNVGTYKSLIFFGSVNTFRPDEYYSKLKSSTDEEKDQDMAYQISQLAAGLVKKFSRLKVAGIFIALQFLILIPFIILYLINVKN